MGDRLIGVRTNDPALDGRLRALVPAHVVDSVVAPPNLSLFAGTEEAAVRQLHRLHRGGRAVVRTRSMGRLLRAAIANLDSYETEHVETIPVAGRLLVHQGWAIVVDPVLDLTLGRIERRVERLAYQVADVPALQLRPETLEVVVRRPRLRVDPVALQTLDAEDPPTDCELDHAPARYAVRALILCEHESDVEHSPARLLVNITRLLAPANDDRVRVTDLAVARRISAVWPMRSCPADDAALLGLLRDLAAS